MKNSGWMARAVTQEQGTAPKRPGTPRTSLLVRTTHGALILGLALGAIGATDAAAISRHASGEYPRISLSSQQTAPGNDISNHWMY
jgi:hypothetical protein